MSNLPLFTNKTI